ncbi:MAG: DUF1893 domain-containing protein [Dehalococcoidales bacterium]|nr:MAG: DUF1893 domain-containing protein [Dehalococcoidales bacterium]
MIDSKFNEFLASDDTLRVYKDDLLLFTSSRERLLPLVDYIDSCTPYESEVTVFDRVVGNAAALLLSIISCHEIHGELGSELAAGTLKRFGIQYQFTETVPYIENNRRDGMCPMEELSLNKTPAEFYEALRERISGSPSGGGNDGLEDC